MARIILNATVGSTPQPAYGNSLDPNVELAAQATNIAAVATAAGTADTDAATAVTANTTALAAFDSFAAAVIAITGDTYTAHQFAFGGATGLTHAQVATTFALLNTALTDFLAAQTAVNTVKTDTAAAVTAAAVPSLTAATAAVAKDVALVVNGATVLTKNKLKQIMDALYGLIANSTNLLT